MAELSPAAGEPQVRLLGPVDVLADGASRPVSGLRRAAVLATLALHPGQVVSTDRLVDVVWGDRAPPTAATTLQNHVSYLRRLLGRKAAIRGPAARLPARPGRRRHGRAARRAAPAAGPRVSRSGRGAAHLRAALALWRGRPLADLTGLAWLEEQAERLDLLGVQVRRALFEARLAAGEHETLVPDLEQMAAERPLDEQVQAQLMLALYRSGRQADALAAYQRLRQALDEELGIEPSQLVRDLETAILRQDRALDTPGAGRLAPASMPVPVPPSCRRPCRRFAGARRAGQPRRAAGCRPGRAARPRWSSRRCPARRASARPRWPCTGRTGWPARFPDGQLYVNLRGFDPAGAAVDAGRGGARLPGGARGAGRADPGRPGRPGRACTAACWPASGCWWCWTTRATPSRSARCCPARPAAWPS